MYFLTKNLSHTVKKQVKILMSIFCFNILTDFLIVYGPLKQEMEDKENNWQVHQTKKKRKEVIRGSKRVMVHSKVLLAIVIYI